MNPGVHPYKRFFVCCAPTYQNGKVGTGFFLFFFFGKPGNTIHIHVAKFMEYLEIQDLRNQSMSNIFNKHGM